MLPAQPNQSLINGLACLQAVVTSDRPLGSREVARQLGLEHTRVNRLLGTLCYLGLVERTPARRYRPGPGVHVLAAQSLRGSGLLAAALPHLRPLADEKLAIAMGVLWGRSISYLIHAKPGQGLDEAIGAHGLYPAHESILGLALMAHLPDREVRRRLSREPGGLPRAAIAEFLSEARRTRSTGYAVKTMRTGLISVAAVVGDPPACAIAFSGIRDASRAARLASRLVATAGLVAEGLRE